MARPKLYKSNNIWYCETKNIQATGATPREAFFNFILRRATEHLHEDEVKI